MTTPAHERARQDRAGPVRLQRDRPIIFSASMVQALLAGRKSQTRRLVKSRRRPSLFDGTWSDDYVLDPGNASWREREMPAAAGDRLWVKEGFARVGDNFDDIHACPDLRVHAYYRADDVCPEHSRWRSPIFMPRWASRLTLIVEAVKVERLQNISEEDAVAEGLKPDTCGGQLMWDPGPPHGYFGDPRVAYRMLWSDIHGPAAWDANPWICAISFKCVQSNVDALGSAA